jgi:hypothetical protein
MRDVELSITWIVCTESDGHPPGHRHINSVVLNGVDKVVVRRVLGRVKVAEPLPDLEEVGSNAENTGALHHHLHDGNVW